MATFSSTLWPFTFVARLRQGRCWPWTLFTGAGLILACEVLLFIDVGRRGWLVAPLRHDQSFPMPIGRLGWAARWVATNMTVLCWIGYLLTFDGLLTALAWRRGRIIPALSHEQGTTQANATIAHASPLRARPNRFMVAWLSSIPVWCFFDWVNFNFMHAWRYLGLSPDPWDRYPGYFIAFAAISPGMFLAAQFFQQLGFYRLRTAGVRIPRPVQIASFLLGIGLFVYPFLVHDPIANLTLWVSLIFLLDPINYWLGVPTILGDWKAGRWGRTLALMAGGAVCGLCWEFWNYWAIAKWTYHLPFLGGFEQFKYFEMPWVGFQGFLPFALECWIVLNTFLAVLSRLGLRVAEPLPDDLTII